MIEQKADAVGDRRDMAAFQHHILVSGRKKGSECSAELLNINHNFPAMTFSGSDISLSPSPAVFIFVGIGSERCGIGNA